jgi:hypothetical protein
MLAFCSTSSMVVPRSRLMRTTISKISLVSLGERPRLGSSSRIRSGLAISAREIDSICCCPPDKQAGVLAGAFLEDREVGKYRFDIPGHAIAVAAGVGAHQQVVAHAQQREHLAALGHMRQALLDDEGRVLGGDVFALELDRTLARIDDARDGLENRGLAGAVGAQHRADLAAAHLQADATNRTDRAIGALDVEQLEHRLVAHRHRCVAHCIPSVLRTAGIRLGNGPAANEATLRAAHCGIRLGNGPAAQ